MKTLYMNVDSADIAKNVLFSGDPWRVETVAGYLTDPKRVAFKREFNTYTGTYKGMPVTVTSTGIGAPSAAIAMEEMYEAGMEVAVRMGTVMSLREGTLGKFIIPYASMRMEKTSATYVPEGYPAVADLDLVQCMNQTVNRLGGEYINGIGCSMDGFYSMMHDSRLSKEMNVDMSVMFEKLKKIRICGVDMESSCILTLGQLMGIKACVLTIVTVLENLKDALEGEERIAAEDLLCRVALEGIYNYRYHV